MKYNKYYLAFFIILSFTFFWYMGNSWTLNKEMSAALLFDDIFSVSMGNTSIKNYALVYSIIFILFLPSLLNKHIPTIYFLTRQMNRSNIFSNSVIALIKYSLFFTISHSVVNILLITVNFSLSLELFNDLIKTSLLHLLLIFCIYTSIGLIYMIIDNLLQKTLIVQLTTFFVVVLLYYLQSLNIWTPFNELVIFISFLYGKLSITDFMWAFFKSLLIIGILLIISSETFKTKDFNYE